MSILFPYLVSALQFCAAGVYAAQGRYWLAGVWLCYAISSILVTHL